MAIKFTHIQEDTSDEVRTLEEQDPGMQQQDPRIKCAEFVARCRAAATAMHFFHLLTSSYSGHKAAQDFYEGIIPLMDGVAEDMIGRFGRFEVFPNVRESATEGLQICGNLVKFIDANRMLMGEYSEIQNGIDEIVSLTNSTAYKLRDLR